MQIWEVSEFSIAKVIGTVKREHRFIQVVPSMTSDLLDGCKCELCVVIVLYSKMKQYTVSSTEDKTNMSSIFEILL